MARKSHFGPAMLALNDRRQKFVIAYCENGGQSLKNAALAAGYGQNKEESAEQAAWRISNDPKVQAAIAEEAQKRLSAGAILAASAIIEIVKDPLHKDRFKAADRLLERGGLMVVNKTQHEIIDNRSTAQLEAFITAKANELGLDPKRLLGARPSSVAEVLDAEYSEVGEDDDLSDILA